LTPRQPLSIPFHEKDAFEENNCRQRILAPGTKTVEQLGLYWLLVNQLPAVLAANL
jgi:hypothetical protein